MTTRCHSVRSLRSPEALSRHVSEVATDRFTTGSPDVMRRTSGSFPRFPTRMTLFTLPAISVSVLFHARVAAKLVPTNSLGHRRSLTGCGQDSVVRRMLVCSHYVPSGLLPQVRFYLFAKAGVNKAETCMAP